MTGGLGVLLRLPGVLPRLPCVLRFACRRGLAAVQELRKLRGGERHRVAGLGGLRLRAGRLAARFVKCCTPAMATVVSANTITAVAMMVLSAFMVSPAPLVCPLTC